MQEPTAIPQGFRFAGHACGIKADPAKLDLALFAADRPCAGAGVFTQNRVVGAPVQISRQRVPGAAVRAVVINSGISNACTGERGLEDAAWMTERVAAELGTAPHNVLVCSTGVIGHFLPREKLDAGIPRVIEALAPTASSLESAARAMMTTDTIHKVVSRQLSADSKTVTVTGVAKGAAMIGPNMATMLAVVMTDATLDARGAQKMLSLAVNDSFNCISVEGHTSTSDTVLLLASGAAGARINVGALQTAITEVCVELAQLIIRDAEGAEHFVTLDVTGCRSREEAGRIAKAVCDGALVKTAITGNDPNWGRIVSAAGYAGVPFEETDCSLSINGLQVYHRGRPTDYEATAVSQAMATGEVHIELMFSLGCESCRFWTSDLTQEYVRINSEYTT